MRQKFEWISECEMAAKVRNMTEGRPASLILTFALSLTAGNVFQQLYTVVDTMVVGKALGVNALAALGASDWMNWMMLGIIQGFTQGFAIMMAKEFGAERYQTLRRAVVNSALLALVSSIVLVIAGQIMVNPVLRLMRTPADIIGNSGLYLRIMFAGIPVVMLYNLLAGILRSLGDSQTPLRAIVIASLVNIGLDLLFVLVFHWGIAGAAAATIIAQLVSSLFCLYNIRKIDFMRVERSDFVLSFSGQLLWLGFPMAFQNAIISVGGMIVQTVVNRFGVLFIAGFTATNKLYGLLEIAAISYGYAMVTYVGQNYGAGKIQRIRQGMRSAMWIAMATSLVITAFMLVFGKNILGLFISGTAEVVERTMEIAYFYLAVMSICLPVLYALHVIRSTIQGLGNTVLPMLSGIAEFVMRTSSALILPLFFGETGIFFAEILAWTGAAIVLVASYFKVMKKLSR